MYDELIKNLRICSRCDFGQDCNGCTQDKDDRFCCDILLHNAADVIEGLLAERDEINADSWKRAYEVEHDEHRWISVTERLPELNTVIQITDGIDVGHGYLASITSTQNMVYPSWHSPFCDVDETHITHWMPLPQPPKGEV